MKNTLFAILLLTASCAPLIGYAQVSDSPPYWSPLDSEHGRQLQLSSDVANIAVGPRIDYSLVDFQFIDANLGVAVGNGADVGHYPVFYKTTDGGATWSKQQLQVGWLPWSIAFRNKQEGFITTQDVTGCPNNCLQKNVVLRTSDGGSIWELIDYVNQKGVFQRIEFDSKGNAYALRYFEESGFDDSDRAVANSIVKSIDFGESWETFYRPTQPNYNLVNFALHDDLLFLPTENGSVIELDAAGAVSAEYTTGYRYIQRLLVGGDGALFANVSNGEETSLVRSTDQGATWTTVLNQLDSVVSARSAEDITVIFWIPSVSDVTAFIGALGISTDGGNSWARSESIHQLTISKRQLAPRFDFLLMPDRILSIEYK